MNHGVIKCYGSPAFLKNLYGTGYRLSASKNECFKEDKFFNLIRKNIEAYEEETNSVAEIKISLPSHAVEQLANILSELEVEKENIGVTGYGISSPSICDVFIK